MVTVAKIFAKKFNKALDEAGIPTKGRQYLVRRMFGVSSTMGWKWIKGHSMPSYERLALVAKKLNREICYFLEDENPSNVIQFPRTIRLELDEQLLGIYLEKIEQLFPEYGFKKLTAYQKAAFAKIGYDDHLDKENPDDARVTADVIKLAQVYRASGGS